jgi:uncharacterized protein YwgA
MFYKDGEEDLFKYPAIIGCLVKELARKYPGEQIGKTKLQKLLYLLTDKQITKNEVVNFYYSLHYYGPYSSEASSELSFAESRKIVRSEWKDDKGFFFKPGDNEERVEKEHLNNNEKLIIQKLVNRFGKFNARELTIITTYLFLSKEDEYSSEPDKIVEEVCKMKNYSINDVCNTLKDAEVLLN